MKQSCLSGRRLVCSPYFGVFTVCRLYRLLACVFCLYVNQSRCLSISMFTQSVHLPSLHEELPELLKEKKKKKLQLHNDTLLICSKRHSKRHYKRTGVWITAFLMKNVSSLTFFKPIDMEYSLIQRLKYPWIQMKISVFFQQHRLTLD